MDPQQGATSAPMRPDRTEFLLASLSQPAQLSSQHLSAMVQNAESKNQRRQSKLPLEFAERSLSNPRNLICQVVERFFLNFFSRLSRPHVWSVRTSRQKQRQKLSSNMSNMSSNIPFDCPLDL